MTPDEARKLVQDAQAKKNKRKAEHNAKESAKRQKLYDEIDQKFSGYMRDLYAVLVKHAAKGDSSCVVYIDSFHRGNSDTLECPYDVRNYLFRKVFESLTGAGYTVDANYREADTDSESGQTFGDYYMMEIKW